MHSENVFSEGTKKPLRAEFVSCSHAWGLKGFFSYSKREVSDSLGCVDVGLFSWSHQGVF